MASSRQDNLRDAHTSDYARYFSSIGADWRNARLRQLPGRMHTEGHAEGRPVKLRIPLGALLSLSVVINLLMLTGPLYMLQVYDRVLASRSIPTLLALTGLIVVLYGFGALLDAIRTRMAARISARVEAEWSDQVFGAVLQLRRTGELAGPDPVRDLDTVRQVMAGGGPIALLDLPWVPIYLLLVFALHPLLGVLAVLGALVIGALLVLNELSLREPSKEAVTATVRKQQFNDDARVNAEAIHAMAMRTEVISIWRKLSADFAATQLQSTDKASIFASISKGFRYFLQSAVLGLGAYLVIRGEMSGGVMIGASMIAARALAPIDQLVAQWRPLKSAQDAVGRLNKLLVANQPSRYDVDLPLPHRSLVISGFSSGPNRKVGALVSGISLQLEAGDGLGILGLSGCGKSSLIRGILGIWPTLSGEVRLDGAALNQYDPERLGRAIGYLPQVVDLFDGTIAQNIARFRPDASSEQIIAAAQAAKVHELILSFKAGYDTRVGELGSSLSAGQRQRIGLARALFGSPFLIVLDEPNSNLDAIGDEALTSSMLAARARGAIVIIVAHRPSAIASVSKLLYLQDGKQSAFGPKESVLQEISRPAPRPATAQPKVASHG